MYGVRSGRFPHRCVDASWSLGVTSYGRSNLSKAQEQTIAGGHVGAFLSTSLQGRRYACCFVYLWALFQSMLRLWVPFLFRLPASTARQVAGCPGTRASKYRTLLCRPAHVIVLISRGIVVSSYSVNTHLPQHIIISSSCGHIHGPKSALE